MSEQDDKLQERIERFENGEALESCLVGLSDQEANALRLIASLQAMSFEDVEGPVIADQRAGILQAATVQLNGANRAGSTAEVSFMMQLQTWISKLFNREEVRYGFAAILLILMVGFFYKGMTIRRPVEESEPIVVAPDDTENVVETVEDENVAAVDESGEAVALAPEEGEAVFLPMISAPVNTAPDTAVIQGVQGFVEIQTAPEQWTIANNNVSLAVGQRIRTGDLSQATLAFYDGSTATLSANTELSIDELNALRPEEGFRTVVMTQWVGDSEHSVQFRNDGGSRYEVKTPDGSGIARGTKFHVLVAPNKLSRYIVTEGKVDVSGQNRIVSVIAGQLSTILVGSIPAEPYFNIFGEGEVTATGDEWTIAGQTFQTDEQTIIVGNPQIGDLVRVNGHLLPDGNRVADYIVLLRRAITNHFSIQGEVESMGTTWVVAGQSILVNGETEIDDVIAVGHGVRVEGIILTGGTLQATKIEKVEEAPGLPFQFSGLVQATGADSWTISGQAIAIDEDTEVDDDIEIGDVVSVSGWILDDGRWLASEIEEEDDELPTFSFTGAAQSIDPWRVASIEFETRDWTIVAPSIAVGDMVRVEGSILEDGTWVANTIVSLEDLAPDTITFVGIVGSMSPWIVNGMPLVVDAGALVDDSIIVGSQVIVQAQLLPDGSWSVLSIHLLYPNFGYGCLTLSTPISVINADSIQFKHWHVHVKRDGRIKIHGDLKVNNVTTLPICTGWDGTPIIIGDIIVIYQPVVIIINDGGGNTIPSNCRVTSKGSIKCSNKGSRGSKGS